MRGTAGVKLLLLILAVSFVKVSARIGVSWAEDVEPRRLRSVDDLSSEVFEELLRVHERGPVGSLQIPNVARRIHRIVVEGSANEGEDFDHNARGRALKALNDGSDRLLEGISDQEKEMSRRALASDDSRELLSAADAAQIIGVAAFSLIIVGLVMLILGNVLNGAESGEPINFFQTDSAFVTGTPGASFKNVTPCERLPLQLKPNAGEDPPLFSYLPITQGLIGNLLGLVDGIGPEPEADGIVNVFRKFFDVNGVLEEKGNIPNSDTCLASSTAASTDTSAPECVVTADCCKVDGFVVNCNAETNRCEKIKLAIVPGGYSVEPFCLMWSKTASGRTIDTFGFVPLNPYPPISLLKSVSLLPVCPIPGNPFKDVTDPVSGEPTAIKCKACAFYFGFPITKFAIGPFRFKLTIQIGGLALSWAVKPKLAFGANAATADRIKIWDGFRNQMLPEIPGINLWIALTFNIVPLELYEFGERLCASRSTPASPKNTLGQIRNKISSIGEKSTAVVTKLDNQISKLAITLDFELYVGVGGTDDEEKQKEQGKKLADDLAGETRRNLNSDGQDLWRDLQETGEDPCSIVALTNAKISVPLIGTLVFGQSAGGFCNFSPEPTGVRCSPSGFFFNIDQRYTIESGLAGVLASILASKVKELDLPPNEASGNSIGIFQNPDGENEAIVFRLESSVDSLFGISLGGALQPVVQFQYLKGSEIERRRQTILRTRTRDSVSGNFTAWRSNCVKVGEEYPDDESWASFYKDEEEAAKKGTLETETEICIGLLINPKQNPDKLLYYNRVLTADTLDPKRKYDKTPPKDSSFVAPEKYRFEDRENDSVVIVYLALRNIGGPVISIEDVSITLIVSDGPPASAIEPEDLKIALAAYDKLADDLKAENGGVWEKPSGFNFPSLDEYLDYLPDDGDQVDLMTEMAKALVFNEVTDATAASELAVFIRIFCEIRILFFVKIPIGLIMENYVNTSPNIWEVTAMFEIDLVGLSYSVSATTAPFAFDTKRRRHLEAGEYERALAEDGLESADWIVGFSVSCGGACEAFVEFFKDVGEAISDGVVAIGKFFEEDVANFAKAAIALVGEWGKAFIGAIEDFAKGVVDDFKKVFENGSANAIITSGRFEAFGDDAKSIVSSFSDGKYDLESFVEVGRKIINLAVDALVLAGEFILAGVKDVFNALRSFFTNVAGAVVKAFTNLAGTSPNFDQLRQGSAYYVPTASERTQCNTVLANPNAVQNDIKKKCWFTDELDCRVKLPEVRTCDPQPFFQVSCGGYRLVKIEQNGGFPRFAGREFDGACRQERLAKLAMAEKMQGKMKVAGKVIDDNFQDNFRGLSNFAKNNTNSRRKLQDRPETMVQSVEIPFFTAVGDGIGFGDTVTPPGGKYSGAALQSNTSDTRMVDAPIGISFDFKDYVNPGEIRDNDGGSKSLQMLQRGAAEPYLDGLDITDPAFLAKQPIIEPPKLSRDNNAGPFEFKCVDPRIALAFKSKLQSASPETLLRKRTRRLLSDPFDDSVLEIILERILVEKIKANEEIQVVVTAGGILGGGDGTDLFEAAKGLLGTKGAGAFLDPGKVLNRRRLQSLSILDFEVEATVTKAIPFCDRLEWEFNVTATDISGTSNTLVIDAFIMFGNPEISDVSSEIQTRCDSTPIGVEELEDDSVFQNDLGVDTLKPVLKVENCPSPYLFLQADADIVVNNGTVCTTDYKTVQRNWSLKTTEPECGVPSQVFTQVITLGGLILDGTPSTPMYELQDFSYDLPNIRVATIATQVSDFYLDGVAPADECGICTDPQKPGIVYSHPQNFECSEVGVNPVDVTVLNTIGVSVTKSANAFVFDDFPTNIITKPHTVFLNKFGSLSEADMVTVEDIDDGSWDNCGIRTRVVGPTPIYQCGDEGPQTTRLKIVDVNDNGSFQDETVTVDDSRRLAIGDDRYLSIVRRETENLVAQKLADDFVYYDCYELAVYLRLKGDSNFFRLEYPPQLLPGFPGWNGDYNWVIPPYNEYDPESVLFHQALCDGVPLKQQGPSPCVAELKAEVLCTDGLGERRQTCYRAKLVSTDECPSNDEKALPTRVGKGSRSQDGCA